MPAPAPTALVRAPARARADLAAVVGPGIRYAGQLADVLARVAEVERSDPVRWVCWSAEHDLSPAVAADLHLRRCHDLTEVHRLLHGSWRADAGDIWGAAHGIPADRLPAPHTDDLFASHDPSPQLLTDAGALRPDAVSGDWVASPERLLDWADAALTTAARQQSQATAVAPAAAVTMASESAAALLCVELARDGLPIDRDTLAELIAEAAGQRPRTAEEEIATRRRRDAEVLRHTPGRESTDLRNPAHVRELLAAVGVDEPTTRKWVLEPYRAVHPVVDALLRWRAEERIATTYGWRWLDAHVGPDDRLRGRWTACDGGAGRMTAESGLHNLPTHLRPGVAAHPGHVLVRADLGQIEPRVLAAVSGDGAFAQATLGDDLYAPVATRLGVDRATAKIAVLAAMYGQRSGPAADALAGLERAFPRAMALLDDAYAVGLRGGTLRTHGGRLLRTQGGLGSPAPGADPAVDRSRGRFARNAIIQGAAAELFKGWAALVRLGLRELGGQIVLCLHDELVLHVPQPAAPEAVTLVHTSLAQAAAAFYPGAPVRFVADVAVVRRWSEAKG